MRYDAIVLAGGAARRLAGAEKPSIELHGIRLIDHVLTAVAGAHCRVVVGPATLSLPAGVHQTLEHPPGGGPVAGIAAGMVTLATQPRPAGLVAVLACDQPGAASALPRLLAACDADVDGTVLRDNTGQPQWLLSVLHREKLAARLAQSSHRNQSVHSLLGQLALRRVAATGNEARDIDTPADLRAARDPATQVGRTADPPKSAEDSSM